MCADDTGLDPTQEPISQNDDSSSTTPQDTSQDSPKSGPIWAWPRRKFLAAAALGTAAAALIGKDGGLQLGPATASAAATGTCPSNSTVPDLSFLSCTANDVNIVGNGIVMNEPCAGCGSSGTFDANVKFTVNNGTGTNRYCIVINIGDGLAVPCQTVILENLTNPSAGSTAFPGTNLMQGTILGFPCNAAGGLVCLGAANTPANGACPAECVTVGWSTSTGSATCSLSSLPKVPGGQCRHQQICIQGFGVQVHCSDASCGTGGTAGCSALCGAPLYLKAIGAGFTDTCNAAPALTLKDQNGVSYTATSSSVSGVTRTSCWTIAGLAGGSYTFTVTATDCQGCTRTSSIPVTVTVVAKPVVTATLNNPCTGSTTYAVTNCDSTLTYTYQEVDCTTGANIGTAQSGTGMCSATFTFAPGATAATHCVNVTAANSTGCTETTPAGPITVPAQLTVSLASTGTPGCDGVVNLTATASGGSGNYTSFTFGGSATGTVSGSGNVRTLTVQPLLNGSVQSSSVVVVDSNGCTATSGSVSWSSCVTTTFR